MTNVLVRHPVFNQLCMNTLNILITETRMTKTGEYLKIKGMSPQLLVADLTRSVAFYTQKLGFEIAFNYADFYCGITRGAYSIHLKSAAPTIAERAYRIENEHIDIMFSVEGIDALYAEISDKSIRVIQPLRDMPYGREFYIADPDGYIIAFLEENQD